MDNHPIYTTTAWLDPGDLKTLDEIVELRAGAETAEAYWDKHERAVCITFITRNPAFARRQEFDLVLSYELEFDLGTLLTPAVCQHGGQHERGEGDFPLPWPEGTDIYDTATARRIVAEYVEYDRLAADHCAEHGKEILAMSRRPEVAEQYKALAAKVGDDAAAEQFKALYHDFPDDPAAVAEGLKFSVLM
jgi:hypothetical protein